jgi:uncharacterized protein (TIGR04141 family)
MEMAVEKTSLSAYLLRSGANTAVEQALFRNAVPLSNGLEGKFAPIYSDQRVPTWLTAISPYLATGTRLPLLGQNPAGLLLIYRGAKAFVITFGHAWQKLEPQWIEFDFGRRVALNSVPPDRVLEVNSEQVFAKWHLARERSPRATSVKEFGLEHDRDLVAAIEGAPSEPIFGGTLRGSTSLRMSIPIQDLGKALDRAGELFESDAYKKRWPEIDNIVPVEDDATVAKLDTLLDADLQSGVARGKAVMFTPSFRQVDVPNVDAYAFGRLTKNPAKLPYLLFGSWEQFLKKYSKAPSLVTARESPVHLFDSSGDSFDRRSVYDCLGYEITHNGQQYILSSGKWFVAASDFISSVNRSINALKPSPFALPPWDQKQSEGEYNRLCCRSGELLHFDAKLIPFGGPQSKFEFCDFMHPKEKILFFAKIPTRSSDCSHLAEQVRRTVELLFGLDDGFRKRLKKAMEKHYSRSSRSWLDRRPRPGDWKLCLVSLGKDKQKLPFFAKCTISRLTRTLEQIGHPVYFSAV